MKKPVKKKKKVNDKVTKVCFSIRRSDKKTLKDSLKVVSLILLIAGFLFNQKSLIGVGLVVLIVFFMMK